ncbi:MAG TPA: apolipoprotein N-acyltransferase [Desulfobacteraceae bacterium]|nr:apolipoprotein N-acyltransferase [Desulfobacteraceae bacterium]
MAEKLGRSLRNAGAVVPGSLATAIILAAAMPGRLGWWPLLFVALVPLLLIVSRRGAVQSTAAGMLAGFLYHVCLLYWIVIVLGRYGGLPPWLSVPALLLLAVYMGVYMAVFAGLLAFFKERCGPSREMAALYLAPVLWVGLDWLRGVLFSGFPWMDLGYGLASAPRLVQAADLGGHHLISFCLVLVNVLLVQALTLGGTRRRPAAGEATAVIAALSLLLLVGGYSLVRQAQLERVLTEGDRVRVGVVQGNIAQDEKWTPGRKSTTLDIYGRLSETLITGNKPDLLVWPETAIPFYPAVDPLFAEVAELAARHGIWLLSGVPHYTLDEVRHPSGPAAVVYYNSALLIGPEGEPRGRYDKQHLVPFGEYVPLRRLLPFLEPLVESVGNFSPGVSGEPLEVNGMRVGTLICYESIFPGLSGRAVAAGANLLVNLTNDAWYGRSSAPHQSFAMAVFRAVETRRSLVRAANTGISGFVSPLGSVVSQSALFEPAALAAEVPLYEGRTVYTLFGRFFGPACLVLVSVAGILFLFQRQQP